MAKSSFKKEKHLKFITGIILAGFLAFFVFQNNLLEPKSAIFKKCVVHTDYGKNHTHATLTILQDGKKVKVPKNIGISSDCMHPLHTHDDTGLIHMEYPRKVTFTLGDFFDVMGIIFVDGQIGELKALDGYNIEIKENNKKIVNKYRDIVLNDFDKIDITVTSPE